MTNSFIIIEASKINSKRTSEKNLINKENDSSILSPTPIKKTKSKVRHEKSMTQNSGIVIDKWTMLLIIIATFIIGSLFGLGFSNLKIWM